MLCNCHELIILTPGRGCFNSLFVGMCFAMKRSWSESSSSSSGFNSLFVGMCFAMLRARSTRRPSRMFQFPFRRDVLCNDLLHVEFAIRTDMFQFPFRRDVLCNATIRSCDRSRLSLFQFPFRRDVLCNNRVQAEGAGGRHPFQFPFRRDVLCNCRMKNLLRKKITVSIPFSSGCALQSPLLL